MKKLAKGLEESERDDRDFTLGALINWPKLEELPEEFTIAPLSIKNQLADGNDDYCAAASSTGMIEPKEEVELFYPFHFAAAKFVAGKDPSDWGLRIEEVAKALQKCGVPEVKDVPAEIQALDPVLRRQFERYPEAVKQAAEKHRIQSYFVLDGPYDAYDTMRAAIWYFRNMKQMAFFGVKWGWDLSDFELTGTPEGFGHAMWANGWLKDGLSVVNSAGREAGHNGCHALSRETYNHYAAIYKPMMCVDVAREDAEDYYLAHGIKLDDNEVVAFLKALLSGTFLKKLWLKQ